VALVEALRVDVLLVDVDLERRAALLARGGERRVEQLGADRLVAALGLDVQLLEQGDRAGIPHAGAEGEQRDADRPVAAEQGDDVVAGEHRGEALGEHLRPGRRVVELGVEVVQQARDLRGVRDLCPPDGH
jgi:hypothetical protein